MPERIPAGDVRAGAARPGGGAELGGRVVEALPNGMYHVELDHRPRARVTAHVASAGLLRVLPGDRVFVELMPYDATRARIVRRGPAAEETK